MKKKVLMMLLLPIAILFSFFLTQENRVFATEHADVITRMYLTDSQGNDFTSPSINQWQQFRINVDFKLHNNEIMAGDTTIVQLPDVIALAVTSKFNIEDQDGNLVAKAVVDRQTKTVTITYEPYVETHSDVKGTFYFYVRVDHNVEKTEREVPIDITVGGKIFPAGKIHFKGIGQIIKEDLNKVGWQHPIEPTIGRYSISVNRTGKAMTGVKIKDVLKIPNAIYKQDTFRVYKGSWVFRDGDWALDNAVDITAQTPITFSGDNFSLQLPDLSANEGIRINYAVQLPYAPSDGETFLNAATLTTTNGIDENHQSAYTYYHGNGKAEGYTFKVRIKKVSEDGSVLKGAKFDVVRDRSGQVIAQVETNAEGIAEVDNLLKDDYTLKETQAPEGYNLATDVKITPDDFDTTLRIAEKIIVDKKKTPASAQLVANKVLTGRDLKAGEFSFTLYDSNGNEIETVTNTADGSIGFSPLSFSEAGTYTYTIKEMQGNLSGITYDTTVLTATIKVEDNGQGQLLATVSYEGDKQSFTNSYTPPGAVTSQLSVEKLLEGRDLKDAEFSFSLRDASGKIIETVKNKADGSVSFTALTFSKEGTYTYTIREEKGDVAGVSYDESEIKVTITVTNSKGKLLATVNYEGGKHSFKNSYTPPSPGGKKGLPKTGTTTSLWLIFAGGLGLTVAGFLLGKKSNE